MNHRWLTIIVATFIAAVIFIFFWLRLQPVWTPEKAEEQSNTISQQTITTPTITFINPKKGAAEPKVTLVVFGDFQCQPCKDLAESIDVLLRTIPTVQIVWKDMPNESAHDLAVPTAIAARCAANQGKFWEYHDLLFDKQVILDEEMLSALAVEVGLDTDKFNTCYNNQETLPLVRKDYDEALSLSITATPTVFIGENRITGSLTADELIELANQNISTAP